MSKSLRPSRAEQLSGNGDAQVDIIHIIFSGRGRPGTPGVRFRRDNLQSIIVVVFYLLFQICCPPHTYFQKAEVLDISWARQALIVQQHTHIYIYMYEYGVERFSLRSEDRDRGLI